MRVKTCPPCPTPLLAARCTAVVGALAVSFAFAGPPPAPPGTTAQHAAAPATSTPNSDDAAAQPACAQPAERPTVRAKRVGSSWEVSIRAGGWRRIDRLAKQPLGLQRSADGAYIAYVNRDFRPDGVLVIQHLETGDSFQGNLNALPATLCFAADGSAVLLEAPNGERSPVALSNVTDGD